MPPQEGQSNLFSAFGDAGKKAFQKHKGDETVRPSGGGLPAGIENGVAKLAEVKVDVYKKGDYTGKKFLYMRGVVLSPQSIDGIPVAGRHTSYMQPMCDTKNADGKVVTFDEHYKEAMNAIRLLGVDTNDYDDPVEFDAAVQALVAAETQFLFRTWKGKKQTTGKYAGVEPRVNEVWLGSLAEGEQIPSPEPGDGTDDASAPGPEADSVDATGDGGADDTSTESAEGDSDDEFAEIIERCESVDEKIAVKARKEFTKLATDAGVDPTDVNAATSWEEVAALIRAAREANGGSETPQEPDETTEEEWKPKKTEVYGYRPVDPKTKKPVKNKIDCEVTAVDAKNETVDLKNLVNTKLTYKAVKWDKLVREE